MRSNSKNGKPYFVAFVDEDFFPAVIKMINKNEYGTMNKTALDDLE